MASNWCLFPWGNSQSFPAHQDLFGKFEQLLEAHTEELKDAFRVSQAGRKKTGAKKHSAAVNRLRHILVSTGAWMLPVKVWQEIVDTWADSKGILLSQDDKTNLKDSLSLIKDDVVEALAGLHNGNYPASISSMMGSKATSQTLRMMGGGRCEVVDDESEGEKYFGDTSLTSPIHLTSFAR